MKLSPTTVTDRRTDDNHDVSSTVT